MSKRLHGWTIVGWEISDFLLIYVQVEIEISTALFDAQQRLRWMIIYTSINIPLQLCPSPEYPSLQEQLYPPLVLLQTAFKWHLWEPLLHSSISKIKVKHDQEIHSCSIHPIRDGSKKERRFATDRDGSPGSYDPSRIVTDCVDLHTGSHVSKRDSGSEPQLVYIYPWKSWRSVTIRDKSPSWRGPRRQKRCVNIARSKKKHAQAKQKPPNTVTAVKQPCTTKRDKKVCEYTSF